MHSPSTFLAQVFHRCGRVRDSRRPFGLLPALLAAILLHVSGVAASDRQQDPGTTYRIFLTNGYALASYGEAARVGDRLIFTLLIGSSLEDGVLQLVSLPVEAVDLERTSQYAVAMRAARYAATRGEADYVAMTAEVQRSIARLVEIRDPKERILLAEAAKRRLLTWSRDRYHYRRADILTLAALFDDMIAELRVAAGESSFAMDLVAGAADDPVEPLLPPPDARESIALALVAAESADLPAERQAILATAATASSRITDLGEVSTEIARRLALERAADEAYAALGRELRAAADVAMALGDVNGAEALAVALDRRDEALGRVRPADAGELRAWLEARLEATRRRRVALERYALARRGLLDYEREIRPVLNALDGLAPVFDAIASVRGPSFERLLRAETQVQRLARDLKRVSPPDDVADVQATLASSLHMAAEACARRRLAAAAENATLAAEASTAASGARLLIAQARTMLVERLFPPKLSLAGQ